jgi:TRAP transporter TAXI family solute receptor
MSASMGRVMRALAIGIPLAIAMSITSGWAETSVRIAQYQPTPQAQSAKPTPPQAPAAKPARQAPTAKATPAAKPKPRATTAGAIGEGSAATANKWTIGLASGLPEGTFIRFGGEIARNLNDGDKLRVIPMITYGATDNVKDLLHLRGVDVAFTHADVLEHFRTVEKIPNIEKRINYVAGMYLSHIHVLARPEINSIYDLAGKKVSFHTPGAGTSVSAPILFQRLGIKVVPVPVNNAIALEQMKTGELAALVNTGAKPQALFTEFQNDYGYKFLPIPFEKFDDLYVPSVFTSEDYPGYIKPGERVSALGVPAVLAVYNWPKGTDRYRRLERFIEYFFDRFEGFQQPPYHPAWKTINLTAKVSGWTRYWVAEEKVRRLTAAAAKSQPPAPAGNPQPPAAVGKAQPAGQQAARAGPGTPSEQERLFREFLEWTKRQPQTR